VISVVVPVKNGGTDLVRCLEAIARQEVADEVEVVVVDSGSTDGTPERARRLGARVHELEAAEFNYGRSRNLGVDLSRGEILVFTSHDASAADTGWLARLVAPLASPEVAGVYGRQLPYEDAPPTERYFLDFLYGPRPRVQRLTDPRELTFETTLFSNVNSAIPRRVWEEHPFAEDVVGSEDQEWSRRVLLAGRTIVYEPRAAVFHSHTYTLSGAFRRFFDSGVASKRSYLGGGSRSRRALADAALRYASGELGWLWRTGRRRWIPYAVVLELAKFTGLQLGRRHRLLPKGFVRRVTLLPAYWERDRA
jgi:rhamnosyltransferase